MITAGHQAYQRAVREAAPEAVPVVTGLHRAPGYPTPQLIERSPVKDRVRPMRGLQSITTGQQLVEVASVGQPTTNGRRSSRQGRWIEA